MDSRLLDYLPESWRSNPTARGLANAVGRPFDRAWGLVQGLPAYVDPKSAPTGWLDWLASLVALPHRPGMDHRRKRRLIAIASRVWDDKGSTQGLTEYIRAASGVSATVTSPAHGNVWIAGSSRPGDVPGPGVLAWTYEIRVPAGSISEGELRALLEPVAPTFATFTFIEV